MLAVYELAHKFLLPKLATKCEFALETLLNSENAPYMLRKTIEIGEDSARLKDMCYNFIMNNFGEVIGTPGFVHLPQEILAEILSKASQIGVKLKSNNNESV